MAHKTTALATEPRCVGRGVPSCTNNQLCPSAGTLVCPASSDLPANPRAAGQSQAHPACFGKNVSGGYTFLYVPCNPLAIIGNCVAKLYVPIRSVQPSRDYWELCCKVIRSYTFPCNSLVILANYVAKLYVPIRSTPPLSQFLQFVSQSYTFLYVPKKFLYVPAGNLKDALRKLYVPIRSYAVPYTFLRVIFKNVSGSYTFLYVPSKLY